MSSVFLFFFFSDVSCACPGTGILWLERVRMLQIASREACGVAAPQVEGARNRSAFLRTLGWNRNGTAVTVEMMGWERRGRFNF